MRLPSSVYETGALTSSAHGPVNYLVEVAGIEPTLGTDLVRRGYKSLGAPYTTLPMWKGKYEVIYLWNGY